MTYRLLPFEALFMVLKHRQMDCCQSISKSMKIINVVTSSHFLHHKFYQVSTILKQLNKFCHQDLLPQTLKSFPYISPVCPSHITFFFCHSHTNKKRKKTKRKNKNKPCELSNLISGAWNLPE